MSTLEQAEAFIRMHFADFLSLFRELIFLFFSFDIVLSSFFWESYVDEDWAADFVILQSIFRL